MKPVITDNTNANYVAENCGDLPAMVTTTSATICWEMTDEELKEINKTKRIYLHIMGKRVPPLMIDTKEE